jgi:hypothetical protein
MKAWREIHSQIFSHAARNRELMLVVAEHDELPCHDRDTETVIAP